jgi:TonB family protein
LPLAPQFAAEGVWQTPLRSQQPDAQFAGPHFSGGDVKHDENVASAAETRRSRTMDMHRVYWSSRQFATRARSITSLLGPSKFGSVRSVIRAPLWMWMWCCLALLGCKPSKVLVEGDVFLDGVGLGFVDVELIPEPQMRAFIGDSPSPVKMGPSRPPAKFSVKTELDGSFFLKATPGPYAVYARANGRTWLFWHTIETSSDQRLQLNNYNVNESGCGQCVQIASEQRVDEAPRASPAGPPAVMVNDKTPPAMVVMGALDKQLVYKVVRAYRGQIRYCHEYQQQKVPGLSGKIAVKFVVSQEGTVVASSIVQSTIGNSELEACIAGRVRTWKFPKPRGGGVAIVTYPFLFAAEGY